MSDYGRNGAPPLPPRSPRSSVGAASPQSPYSPQQQTLSPGYQTSPYSQPPSRETFGSLPGPPPGPPPRSPGASPAADVPPPIPPRPPGWVIQELPRETTYSTPEPTQNNHDSCLPPPPPRPPKEPILLSDDPPPLPARTPSHDNARRSSSHLSPTNPSQGEIPPEATLQNTSQTGDPRVTERPTSSSSTYEEAESSLLQPLGSLSISLSSPDIPAQPTTNYPPPPQRSPVPESNNVQRRSSIPPSVEREQPAPSLSTRPPAPKAISSCLGLVPLPIPGTYAWHKDTPEFIICSKCYVDHIHGSRFRDEFKTQYFDDGKPRACRFEQPKIKDDLFPSALKSGNLNAVVGWMRRRMQVLDCVGIQGLKGGQGLKWYKPLADDIPGFVCCEACYEDHITATSFSSRFGLVPPELHTSDQAWACDMALSYIAKLYPVKSKANDWDTFAAEAKGRLAFDHCPQDVSKGTYHKLWFVPKNGPDGLAFCPACWADNVLLTSEEDKWRQATEWWEKVGNNVACSLGKLNIKMSMAQSQDLKDYSIFWKAVDKLSKAPACSEKGITNGEWFTLPSDPQDFGICKACYVGICEPLNIGHLFKPRANIPRDVPLLCSLNTNCGRLSLFFGKLLETYFTLDITSFDKAASIWARIPPCKRDEDVADRHWYGWFDCTICRECYHEFAGNYPAMVARMEFKDKLMPNNALCGMYSPRMRNLFKETAAMEPINIQPMLEFSRHRLQVYMETVPQMRMMLFQAKMNSQQQMMLNTQSTFYHQMGLNNQLMYGSAYTYSAPGVGGGFANMDLLKAEQYKQQAMGLMSNMPSATMQVGMLEQKWRAVE